MTKFERILGVDKNGNNIGASAEDIAALKEQLATLRHAATTPREQAPVDARINSFLNEYLNTNHNYSWLPKTSFICDKYGISRILSLPENGDEFHSEYVDSYRIYQGILNNPSTDKRTTSGSFHIVEGSFAVPSDKKEIPKQAFANMLKMAFNPPEDMLALPFSSEENSKDKVFVSAYFKPIICPEVGENISAKNMEIRLFLPGSLVSVLDCTESIFGNAGSPFLPENDAAMDPESWSGCTGCIVFAPQLRKCTKKELELPHVSVATDRQKKDGMCWESENELYHDGRPFRAVARSNSGVIVSIIGDSYNGYGKKEIKTQMSYAANMYGLCEEEHSGGALVFPRYDLGDEFNYEKFFKTKIPFEDLVQSNADNMDVQKDGYAIDKNYASVIYIPGDATFNLPKLEAVWNFSGDTKSLLLELDKIYVLPNGYRIHIVRPSHDGSRWKMVGTSPNATFCYKPATVSGGGKSEIAKPMSDAIIHGSLVVTDYEADFALADKILRMDFSDRFRDKSIKDNRGILDALRTLGSVIKLLNFSEKYTDEYNNWLKTIPAHIKELILAVKTFYKESWGTNWQSKFSVDIVNGQHGHEVYYRREKFANQYVRIGFTPEKIWRNFSLRNDFYPAFKLQLADDITSSVTLPESEVKGLNPEYDNRSVKFVHNCEYRLYQRPDEALVPGYDHETEYEISKPNTFTCNYKPLTKDDVHKMMSNRIQFEKYTRPMKELLTNFVNDPHAPKYVVCPSELRIMPSGEVSKNERYLQNRQDIYDRAAVYVSKLCMKLHNHTKNIGDVKFPVHSILTGRRNNPPDGKVRALSVYNPLHYMDLPELFMEYTSSMTGKSPSTTGAGLEGAMTKGPFNALSTVYDLNNALLSFILCDYHGFLSAAGYVGPKFYVEHDVTYILPEIWSRMRVHERNPQFLIEQGYLEPCQNFEHDGKTIPFGRVGYRITKKFVKIFAGRVLSFPDSLFTDEVLHPEKQDLSVFADSMANIVESHKHAAEIIMSSNDIEHAIPPLKALLNIMHTGEHEGMALNSPRFRDLFKRESVVNGEWYLDRLKNRQAHHIDHLKNGIHYLRAFADLRGNGKELNIKAKIDKINGELARVSFPQYISSLVGTIGR
ncbi:MAG: hypothetical protein LBS87_00815 [Puniceicoccales bacterium]|jgi:hypothetical protein|nr:hypothetical protein [Puniceicoccales bacterium]